MHGRFRAKTYLVIPSETPEIQYLRTFQELKMSALKRQTDCQYLTLTKIYVLQKRFGHLTGVDIVHRAMVLSASRAPQNRIELILAPPESEEINIKS